MYLFWYHPALVDEVALQTLWFATDVSVPIEHRTREAFVGERPPEVWVGGSPIKLHLDMIQEAVIIDEHDKNLVRISCVEEWKVAATIVMWHTVAPGLREQAVNGGWFELPVEKWNEVLKPRADWYQRSATFGEFVGKEVYQLRAFVNVTARSETEAPWDAEIANRRSWCVPKMDVLADDPVLGYVESLKKSLTRTATQHVQKVKDGGRAIEDLESWWSARHHHTPSGSSSQRVKAREALKDDARLRAQDRPNKKAVVEVLEDDWIQEVLLSTPCAPARCSTKHEPGDKNRALHANDDNSYFVEAFNSVHMEKMMAFDGMYGKQAPADVVEWIRMHDQSQVYERGWWASTDYKDFNTEHNKAELALCNIIRARAWDGVGEHPAVEDKVMGSYWMAKAHAQSYLRIDEDRNPRVFSGLYSGSRNTLMDHNYMHRGYVDAAIEMIARTGHIVVMRYLAMVGDDEDALFEDLFDAILYTVALTSMGHKANPIKQEAGRCRRSNIPTASDRTHTFLQRKCAGEMVPVRPLAKILATLAGGNWYVEPGVWYDSAIQSTSDNWWECVVRGMDVACAQKLCAATLDRLMIVKPEKDADDTETRWLEWWDYRNPEGRHPLWIGTPGGEKPVASLNSKPDPHESWPSKATDAWMKRVDHILRELRDGRVEMYRDYLLRESIGPSFHHARQRKMRDESRALWPTRVERKYEMNARHVERPTLQQLLEATKGSTVGRRPIDEDEQAARMGVDVYLLKLCGGAYNIMEFLPPDQWGKFQQLGEKYRVNDRWLSLDGAFRAWINSLNAYNPLLHVPEIRKRYEVRFVWMPNGAGKSWLSQRFRRMLDSDVAIYSKYGWGKRYDRYDGGTQGHVEELIHCWNVARDSECVLVLTQWDIKLIDDAIKALGIRSVPICYDPGEQLRRQRFVERGWDEEKIDKFIGYGRTNLKYAQDKNYEMIDSWGTLVRLAGY
jgi:hypothetical protein